MWVEYRGIRILNHHRPPSAYLGALLDCGLRLVYFDEPAPAEDASRSRAANYRRVPWFLVMERTKCGEENHFATPDQVSRRHS